MLLLFFPMQALYECVFCSGLVSDSFGVFSQLPRKLLPTYYGSHKIAGVDGILVVEEDDSFPDPLIYLGVEESI